MIVMPENRLLIDSQRKPPPRCSFEFVAMAHFHRPRVNSIRFPRRQNSVKACKSTMVSVVDNQGNVLFRKRRERFRRRIVQQPAHGPPKFRAILDKESAGHARTGSRPGTGGRSRFRRPQLGHDHKNRGKSFDPDARLRAAPLSTTMLPILRPPTPPEGRRRGRQRQRHQCPRGARQQKPHAKESPTNSYEINKITSNIVQSAGGIKRISTAVFVCATFLKAQGRIAKPFPRPQDELDRLKHIVQSALGLHDANDPDRKTKSLWKKSPFNDQPRWKSPTIGQAGENDSSG